ncbi:MAG: type II secretion system F family protein [Planctomycetes bacterium]|nr:type II secretion system F family protein [Planctomycetota bacterium]
MLHELERAALLRSLARLLQAGLTADALFRTLEQGHRSRSIRQCLADLRSCVLAGRPLSEALDEAGDAWFPRHHAVALRAAERSGEVPRVLRDLADEDEARAHARADVFRRSLYPVALFHMAVIAGNSALLLTRPLSFVWQSLVVMLPVDVALLLLAQNLLRAPTSRIVARPLLLAPLVGEFVRAQEFRSFFAALWRLYEAGVALPLAARESVAVIGNEDLRECVGAAIAPLDQGEPFSLAVAAFPGLREDVRGILATAEPAGELSSGPTASKRAPGWSG